ncbi:ORF8 [Silurid herpesvirus 1]|nr:ORF8 [Silurid herpesvirus 1]AVP72259.1 ORF8 [Silurid herpesvirus 1]
MSFQLMFSMGAEDYCSNHPNAPPGLPPCPMIFEFLETHLPPDVIDGLLIGTLLLCTILGILCTVWCMRSRPSPLGTPITETREEPEGDDDDDSEASEESTGEASARVTPPETPSRIITPEAASIKLDRLRRYLTLRERGFDQRFERLQTLLAIRDELMNSEVLKERESHLLQPTESRCETGADECTSARVSRLVRPAIRRRIATPRITPSMD